MKTETFIPVYDWMIARLSLSGKELLAYALVYSFTAAGGSFTGGQAYLAERINAEKATVCRLLKRLTEKGLVKKTESFRNGLKYCEYRAVALPDKAFPAPLPEGQPTGQKTTPIPLSEEQPTGKEIVPVPLSEGQSAVVGTTPNKKEYNKMYNKEDEKEVDRACADSFSKDKTRYGAYGNVALTDAELAALKEEYPWDYRERIERLSEYIASTGRVYQNHLATIRRWAKQDAQKEPRTAPAEKGRFADLKGGLVL